MKVTLDQQYNIGEKPTVVILYTYFSRHAGTSSKTKTKDKVSSLLFKEKIRKGIFNSKDMKDLKITNYDRESDFD